MPTQRELKSQRAIGTPEKPKDRGMNGKGMVQDMQGRKFPEEDTSHLRIQFSAPT